MKRLTWQRAEQILRSLGIKAKRRCFMMYPFDKITTERIPGGIDYRMMFWCVSSHTKGTCLPSSMEHRVGVPGIIISTWNPEPAEKENTWRNFTPEEYVFTSEDELRAKLKEILANANVRPK